MSPIEPVTSPADTLLAHVEPLPYPQRMRELALHARRLAGSPGLPGLLAELSARGRYERRTALHMAMAARDLGFVAAVLAGPDMGLRRAALRAVRTLPVPDADAARVLDDAPLELRRAFYRTLRHSRRTELAERLLPRLRAAYGDRDAAALLPACGERTVAELLPDLAHAVTAWRALGSRHPRAVLDQAAQEADGHGMKLAVWRRRLHGLTAAALADPAAALNWWERYAPNVPRRSDAAITAFFRVDPVRAAALAARERQHRRGPVGVRLRLWPDEVVIDKAVRAPAHLKALLRRLPPGRRLPVFDAVVARRPGAFAGIGALPVLGLLPADRAAAEARRMLDWHASVWHSARGRLDDPDLPLRITAHLPYAEAAGPLTEAALGGDPDRRGLARTLLVEAAARTRDPGLLRDVAADLLGRVRNEPDPLRNRFAAALAAVPPGLLDDASAPLLDELADMLVQARDTSPAGRDALRALADRLLHHHDSATGIGIYARLVARWGAAALVGHRLDLVLRRGRERDLLDALRPHLRGGHELAVALAASLGRRAHGLGELQDALRAAVTELPEAAVLWLAADPGRVAELLTADPALIEVPEVWRIVAGRRTDLLPGSPPLTGMMPGRWTPAQVDRVRRTLTVIAGDGDRPVPDRLNALRSLGSLPGTLPALKTWADGPDVLHAETALEAMAAGDDPAAALPVLLAHASGPASRVAVAALARCCDAVPPSRLGPVLKAALAEGKVTARKQAARLLERHRPPGAADTLLRAWTDPGLHRDVRVAVAIALRRMPGDPRALDALETATGELMLRSLFQARPDEYEPRHRPRYAALVRRLEQAADGPGVRFRAERAFATWAPWYEGDTAGIVAAVADAADPAGERELPALLALLRTGRIGDEVPGVLESLLAAGPGEAARKRVTAIVNRLDGPSPLVHRATEVLAADPLYRRMAAQLLLTVSRVRREEHRAADEGEVLAELERFADLLRDRPLTAARLAEQGLLDAYGFRRWGRGPQAAVPLPAVRLLLDLGHLTAHLLALALLKEGGPEAGWPEPWRAALDGLRASPHDEVRAEAWDVVPS
ncbi:HEAT repeat domain-containing protein [Actinomadura macrotermitis]|uniref:HEAT repeat domain-containing protein n=1 Tax=Actinomadura macrotermitis TaxID=2585200 RepID=UPI001296F0FB|nr:HEAT repeat domain-containing protein [Actinomadura macrotermitis]